MINSIRELEACMNGIPLSGLHDGIYIADITHKPAELKINTERIAGREGDRILQKSWSKAETRPPLLQKRTTAQPVPCSSKRSRTWISTSCT